MNIRRLAVSLLPLLLVLSCRSSRTAEFDLSKDDYDTSADTARTVLYLKGTRPYDSLSPSAALTTDVWKIETENYPDQIRLFVRVRDSDGYFVTNMAAPYYKGADYKQLWSGLREEIDTGSVPITDFTVREYGANDSIPYSIVLTLDHGGSMGGAINALQDGAALFLSLKQPYDKIGVVKFDRKAVVEVPLSDSKDFLLKQFKKNGLEGYGLYSSVFDAAMTSLSLFRNTPPDVPRVLVLFTDGEDNNSKASDADIYRLAKELNVHIFPVGFGYTNDTLLRALAQETGGKYYRAYSKEELKAIFQDIYLSLRNYYQVSYTPPVYDGLHKVFVSVAPPGREIATSEAEYDKSPLNPFDTLGKRFSTEKIYFDYNKSSLKEESFPTIDNLARLLRRYRRIKLEVRGHTDNIGGETFNQALSERRAEAVKAALVERGVAEGRLRTRGFGLSQPVVPNDTEENRAKNRRTEFVIIAR